VIRNRWLLILYAFLVIVSAVTLFYPALSSADFGDNFGEKKRLPGRTYTLYGSVELSYDWDKFQGEAARTQFIQNYELGLRGVVLAKTFLNFDVSGSFQILSGQNVEGYTLKGANLNVSFLEALPKQWLKYWMFIPNPIRLRYTKLSDSIDNVDYTNYGISLQYSKPDLIKGASKKARTNDEENESESNGNNNGESRFRIPFPVINLDYDRYEDRSRGTDSIIDLLSLRSSFHGKHYDWNIRYEYSNQSAPTEYRRHTVEFMPNYSFYDEKTRRSLSLWNYLKWEKIEAENNDSNSLLARSTVDWTERFGPEKKDFLRVMGIAGYNHLSAEESSEGYFATLTGGYTKVFSPRVTNTATLALGMTQGDGDSHYVRASDYVNVDISRVFRGSAGAFAGYNENGPEYGTDLLLSTKTRVVTTLGYNFSFLSMTDQDQLRHSVTLSASTPAATLSASLIALTNDFTGIDARTEDTRGYSADLFLRLLNMYINLGGIYYKDTVVDGTNTESKITRIYASINRAIKANTILNMYSSWEKDRGGTTLLQIRPRLTWTRKWTDVSVEYEYRRTTQPDMPAENEHRFFVRLIRRFAVNFR